MFFGEVADERIGATAEVTHGILGLIEADNPEQLIEYLIDGLTF